MATTTQKYQILQKVSAEDNILIHPETDADVVKYDNTASQLNATDVKGAIDELKENLDAVTGGGTVTGVKGEAEETYRTGKVNITRANIGLGNVDNTSDMDKPVSTAQQAAIEDAIDGLSSTYIPASQKGTPNGVAELDSTGKVPAAQLPSYVDDIIEGTYVNATTFHDTEGSPVTPESGKLYIDTTTDKEYRWSGTQFSSIRDGIALGETAETAYAGNKGKANADAIAALQAAQGNYQTKTDETLPTTSKTVVGAIGEVKGTADGAASTAAANAEAIADLADGTTPAGKADKLSNARTISVAGDVTGSASFDGSANAQIQTTLKNSGVTAGTYSAVTVDAKGIVTAGAQSIEVGASGQGTPSASLAIGGLFFKML